MKAVNYDITDSFVIAHSAYKKHLCEQLFNNEDKKLEFLQWLREKKKVDETKEKLKNEAGKKSANLYEKQIEEDIIQEYRKTVTRFIDKYYKANIFEIKMPGVDM